MTDSSGNTNATTGVPAAVDRVAVRIPEFCPGDPEMWFSMIERSFEASGVMSENTKFGYVLGALNTRYAAEVRDIIMNPPASEPYTKLKIEFIRRLSVSQEQKTRRLLEHEEIGDRKPSQFLRHLRELAGTAIPDNVLRTLWMGRLPGNMQVILTTQRDTELDKVAELADAIAETMTPRSHIAEAAITGPNTHRQPPPSDWEAALNIKMAQMALSLRQEISAIRESLFNDGPPSRRRWTHRRRSNSREVLVPLATWSQCTQMHPTMQLERSAGKRRGKSLMTANDTNLTSRRLFITDNASKTQFLIDTGADLCVFPRQLLRGPRERSNYVLTAANGTAINTYGTVTLNLHLGLRREFIWRFVVADVSRPIIGVDFLDHFELMVDIRNRRLVDLKTSLAVHGKQADTEVPSVKTVVGVSAYHQLLARMPELTRPSGTPNQTSHQTVHYIKTTPGPPVSSKPRRLAPDRLRAARQEFEVMMKMENIPNPTIQQEQPVTRANITDNTPQEGIGSLKVVPGGIELRGQAAVLDALVASSLRSRRGKNLVLESWSNFTASARSHDGRLLARFTVGEDHVDCVSRGFRITDPRGGILFSADREQVVVGAEMLRVTGDGGAVFQGSVQTPLVRGESGRGLRLESATRSLKISAPQRVVIESWANEISASCLTDLKLQSVHGAISLDAKTLFMKGLKTASPSQGHSSREQQQQQQQHSSRTSSHQSQRDTTIYQLCACANGKLFLARSEGTCQADKSIC
ncbi:SGCZ [Anthophora plagiata]